MLPHHSENFNPSEIADVFQQPEEDVIDYYDSSSDNENDSSSDSEDDGEDVIKLDEQMRPIYIDEQFPFDTIERFITEAHKWLNLGFNVIIGSAIVYNDSRFFCVTPNTRERMLTWQDDIMKCYELEVSIGGYFVAQVV